MLTHIVDGSVRSALEPCRKQVPGTPLFLPSPTPRFRERFEELLAPLSLAGLKGELMRGRKSREEVCFLCVSVNISMIGRILISEFY